MGGKNYEIKENDITMDKIQFRGRRVKGGEWIDGDLVYFHDDTPCIQTNMRSQFGQWFVDAYEIDPATIEMIQKGDNNGKEQQ